MKNIKFFDSHIHLNSDKLSTWYQEKHLHYQDWIFNNVSTNIQDLYQALKQSKQYKNIFITIGIHPLEIDNLDLNKTFLELDNLCQKNSKVIAIGETGLDFYRTNKNDCYELQKTWLIKHIELAIKYNLPLVLHTRNAHPETLDLLKKYPNLKGVVHCFEGDINIANKYLGIGQKWMISISPIVFRNNTVKETIKFIDIENLLVETDAPYLASNHEKVIDIISFIAQEKGINIDLCRSILLNNFLNFFKVKINPL